MEAKILLQQGHAYRSQRNHKKAKEIFQRALKIQMKDFGGDSLDVALTLNYIGDVLQREGRRDQALEQHKRALDIQLKKVGEKHLDTANTYKYIGIALLKQNDDEKAEETLRKALDIMDDLPAKCLI